MKKLEATKVLLVDWGSGIELVQKETKLADFCGTRAEG